MGTGSYYSQSQTFYGQHMAPNPKPTNKFFQCKFCVRYFRSKNLLIEHTRKVHGAQAGGSSVGPPSASSLNYNIMMHEGFGKVFSCQLSTRKCITKTTWKRVQLPLQLPLLYLNRHLLLCQCRNPARSCLQRWWSGAFWSPWSSPWQSLGATFAVNGAATRHHEGSAGVTTWWRSTAAWWKYCQAWDSNKKEPVHLMYRIRVPRMPPQTLIIFPWIQQDVRCRMLMSQTSGALWAIPLSGPTLLHLPSFLLCLTLKWSLSHLTTRA